MYTRALHAHTRIPTRFCCFAGLGGFCTQLTGGRAFSFPSGERSESERSRSTIGSSEIFFSCPLLGVSFSGLLHPLPQARLTMLPLWSPPPRQTLTPLPSPLAIGVPGEQQVD